jgi:hypothetical protein
MKFMFLTLYRVTQKDFYPLINCVNFWVFPQRLFYIGRRFGTLCQVHLQRLEAFEDGPDNKKQTLG